MFFFNSKTESNENQEDGSAINTTDEESSNGEEGGNERNDNMERVAVKREIGNEP